MDHPALAHLDAAYNLARWLMNNEQDARDVVQDAAARALRHASSFRGGPENSAAWMLTIVRRVAYDALRKKNSRLEVDWKDDADQDCPSVEGDPVLILQRKMDVERVRAAIAELPEAIREVIVLRELEEMSYRQIAQVVEVPIGTVMSRLARGRQKLAEILSEKSGGQS